MPTAAFEVLGRIGMSVSDDGNLASHRLSDGRYLYFEADHDSLRISVLLPTAWDRSSVAEGFLRTLDVRTNLCDLITLGSYRDCLLFSTAMPFDQCTAVQIENTVTRLIDYAQHRTP